MADRPRPTPGPGRRPVVGSRTPGGRPRKVASRLPDPVGERAPGTAVESSDADPGEPPHHGLLDRVETLVALVVAIVVLLGAAVLLSRYVWFSPEPQATAERPVVTGEIAHRAAVEAASEDVADILSYGYQDFDEQVAAARSKMTPGFAARFARTAADVRDRFLQGKLDQQVKVRAAGVVRATSTQVQALLFLDQFVTHGAQSKDSTYTPYRALATMVHTEHGWLVDNIDTK